MNINQLTSKAGTITAKEDRYMSPSTTINHGNIDTLNIGNE